MTQEILDYYLTRRDLLCCSQTEIIDKCEGIESIKTFLNNIQKIKDTDPLFFTVDPDITHKIQNLIAQKRDFLPDDVLVSANLLIVYFNSQVGLSSDGLENLSGAWQQKQKEERYISHVYSKEDIIEMNTLDYFYLYSILNNDPNIIQFDLNYFLGTINMFLNQADLELFDDNPVILNFISELLEKYSDPSCVGLIEYITSLVIINRTKKNLKDAFKQKDRNGVKKLI